MILYIAGNLQTKTLELIARRAGANHFLCSFADRGAQETAKYFSQQQQRRIFIDSGAYSAWSQGAEIKLADYIAFCQRIQLTARCPLVFAALDVIPGKKGGPSTTGHEKTKACEEGWSNYQAMLQQGIQCIPTFHQGEHVSWLTRIADSCEYFAVSPRKDLPAKERFMWLQQVFKRIGRSKKIHGLGVASVDWMEQFPFFSVDNTGWLPASLAHLRRQSGRPPRYRSLDDWHRVMRVEESIAPDQMKDDIRRMLGYAKPGDKPDPAANFGVYFLVTLAMEVDVETQIRVTELWRSKGVEWEEQKDIKPHWKPEPWYETEEGRRTLAILKAQSAQR